jgi:hypothetical protein
MNLTRILSIGFLITAIGLAFFLYSRIKFKIDEEKRIAAVEKNVIDKLKMIREAQIAFHAVNRRYTSDWDKLLGFVDTGKFYITQKTEKIIQRPAHLWHLGDSIYVQIDTLGTRLVRDSIFNAKKYPNFNLNTLANIPGSQGKKFELFADRIVKGGVEVDVFEARDVAPVNPKRRAKNNERALRVGSKTDVTTSGNWE